jgi:hypothetical protein
LEKRWSSDRASSLSASPSVTSTRRAASRSALVVFAATVSIGAAVIGTHSSLVASSAQETGTVSGSATGAAARKTVPGQYDPLGPGNQANARNPAGPDGQADAPEKALSRANGSRGRQRLG